MSKRHVEELLQVYRALFQDILYAYPTLGKELDRDLVRLERLSSDRGLHLFVVDLPKAGKHFDRCLAAGEYTASHLPLTGRYANRTKIPKFLRGLVLLVFREDGRLRDDADAQAVFFIRQVYLLAKKAELPSSAAAVFNTVEDFIATDQELPIPESVWDNLAPTVADFAIYSGFSQSAIYQQRLEEVRFSSTGGDADLRRLLRCLDLVSNFIASTLGPYRPEEWSFRHGPGAISEQSGCVDKYSWQHWPLRLENAYPIADYGFHNYASWGASDQSWSEEEIPSRLIAVPKTYEKPRLIAAEPMANQWCQQNIWHYLGSRSSITWIDDFVRFRDQSRNQMMCLSGSRTGDLVTVDLSAASDRVTCHIVGQMFRCNPGLLLHLQACRTRRIRQSYFSNLPKEIDLRKFSTMGSACTFPVQSLIFLAIAVSAVLVERGLRPDLKNVKDLKGEVTVFGDDIIIPKDCRDRFVRALEFLHFKVNTDKTFSEGNFRESCGVDAFKGEDVTPAYWKSLLRATPESLASRLEAVRNFYKKFLIHTSNYLASTIPRDFPMVPIDSGVLSIPSFVEPPPRAYKTRWNDALQRLEIRLPLFKGRVRSKERQDDSALHQYFTDSPSPHDPWRAGIPQRSITKLRDGWVDAGEILTSVKW